MKTMNLFVASSLTDVLSEIVDSFEKKYEVKVNINGASSGTLARQIIQGSPADIYISANQKWANYVDSLGYVVKGLKEEIAQNELALIAPNNSPLKTVNIDSSLLLGVLLKGGRLSIGDPAHVPAGQYAKQSLEYYGWFNSAKQRILPTKDARSALRMVEMGEAPLGIVFKTDAEKSHLVKIIGTFPNESHQTIVYIAEGCNDNASVRRFFAYLNSDQSKAIWRKYGFKK